MDASLLLRGLVVGFSIAAPVGPIGVLCIRRTLADGRAAGLVSGLGAATADAIYGSIAGFGLTFVSGFLLSQTGWLRLVGGAFLLYLGIRTLLSRPAERPAAPADPRIRGRRAFGKCGSRAIESPDAASVSGPSESKPSRRGAWRRSG